MKVLVLCLLPLAIYAVPCTDPPTPSTAAPTTTEYQPPPRSFPRGTYGLIRPDAGCPDGRFKVFTRYWDTEDYNNGNRYSDYEHFKGDFKKDGLELSMCVKTDASTGGDYDWPAGDYCILKRDSCPTGFSDGSIYWDDEDTFNRNSVKGKRENYPDGRFGTDTRLDFCCRSDGSASRAIKLPTGKPFYLLRYKNECQKVSEMKYTLEVVFWDNEDTDNGDFRSGAFPLENGGRTDHQLLFCYYEASL